MARGASPLSWWRRFLALPNDSPAKTVGVALAVALVSSLVVSVTAVTLRPLQEANRLAESAAQLTGMLEILGGGVPEARLVELASGGYVERDPGTQTALSAERDRAGLGSREDVATVFELRDGGGAIRLVVLPVRGAGYQSTLKAYLALKADLNTIAALTFYEQDETPGLGARLEDGAWQALWQGKQAADAAGVIRIEAVKGAATGVHQVDGISGATRTSTGVTNLVRFWLGPDGYGPYLDRLRSEAAP
ncbi:MAG: Na+-translocating NADH-quinone reductase subunit C [Alphaproteobacteria bacterium]|nr:Na+-translocating NADH-quinone reductase subunit C [Alphaproteobacteria bacterium]